MKNEFYQVCSGNVLEFLIFYISLSRLTKTGIYINEITSSEKYILFVRLVLEKSENVLEILPRNCYSMIVLIKHNF